MRERRADRVGSRCSVPRPFWDPDTEAAAITLELALPLLDEAAGGQVDGIIGDTDPFVAVRETRERERFDEVIASTLPTHVSHWLRLDLPARVKRLGLPGHGGHGQTDGPPAHPLVLGLNVLEFVEKKHIARGRGLLSLAQRFTGSSSASSRLQQPREADDVRSLVWARTDAGRRPPGRRPPGGRLPDPI